jgi:hypothetical protein
MTAQEATSVYGDMIKEAHNVNNHVQILRKGERIQTSGHLWYQVPIAPEVFMWAKVGEEGLYLEPPRKDPWVLIRESTN